MDTRNKKQRSVKNQRKETSVTGTVNLNPNINTEHTQGNDLFDERIVRNK